LKETSEEPEVQARYQAGLPDTPLTVTRYQWVTPSSWGAELLGDAGYSLRSISGAYGRRFHPVSDVNSYLGTAFACGLAALSQAKNLSAEQRYSYRAHWLLFQRLLASREHLKSRLEHPKSLRISRTGRNFHGRRSLLPELVGRDSSGKGRSWSLDRLLDEGRMEADEQGVPHPTGIDCVRYGLLCAARRNPLCLQPSDVLPLVRSALYEPSGGENISSSTREAVIERVLMAIERQRDRDAEEFERWFQGPKNSFIGQIAKTQRSLGEVLERDTIRQVLFDESWLAYQAVADCVHTANYMVRRLITVPMNEFENRVFERMHMKQPCFGNLPSFILAERFPQLRPILTSVWEDEDNSKAMAIMHRLLAYYAEMATARRDADRLIKSRKDGEKGRATKPVEVELPSAELNAATPVPPMSANAELLEDLAEELASAEEINCGCQQPHWGLQVDRGFSPDKTTVLLTLCCHKCSFTQDLSRQVSSLRELIGRRI
jgi:hypothetical protein